MIGRLNGIKTSVANKYLRQGVNKAARLVKKIAKDKLKTGKGAKADKARQVGDLGILRESIDFKVRVYGDNKVLGVIGPARGHAKEIGTVQTGPNAGKPIIEDPAKIAHLVEFGHGGPHPAPPHPFMRPAYEEAKTVATQAIRETLEAGLVKELSR